METITIKVTEHTYHCAYVVSSLEGGYIIEYTGQYYNVDKDYIYDNGVVDLSNIVRRG